MRLVKQTERGLCLAACVAMVAGCTVAEVCEKCRILKSQDGVRFLPDNEAIKFLAGKMLCYGMRIVPNAALTGTEDTFNVTVSLTEAPAILSVPSSNFPGFQHAVVWDNETRMVLDPLEDKPKPLSDYQVNEWCVVSHV